MRRGGKALAALTWCLLIGLAVWCGIEAVERQRLGERIEKLEAAQVEIARDLETATGTEAEVAVARARALLVLTEEAVREAEAEVAAVRGEGER